MTEAQTLRFVAEERVPTGTLTRAELLGQGLFETLRWNGQRFPLLPWHEARLQKGAEWLGYDQEQLLGHFRAQLQTEVLPALANSGDVLVRFQWTHSQAVRGYASVDDAQPVTLWQWQALDRPLVVELPVVYVADRPLVANFGPPVKHTSRLDQVVAADASHGKPLIRQDAQGFVREGLSSNLFFVRAGHVYTPTMANHGVDGTLQQWLTEYCRQAGIPRISGDFPLDQVARAEALVLTNALGVQRVNALNHTRYTVSFDQTSPILDGILDALRQFFA